MRYTCYACAYRKGRQKMSFYDRDTMTAEKALQSRALKGKSRMLQDLIIAEIEEQEKKHNEKD
jgi:hypothetical protein